MEFKEVVAKRRSIRKFKPEPISDEQIYQILEAARLAPSGTNRQPWRFLVVKSQEIKQKIYEAAFKQKFLLEAPVIIVALADLNTFYNTRIRLEELVAAGVFSAEEVNSYPGLNYTPSSPEELKKFIPQAMLNTAIAIEHLILAATDLGLGSCWVQLFNPKEVLKAVNLPPNYVVTALVPLGYPAQDPPPRPRISLEEIILGII